jgi:hypothetical protein
MPHAHGESKLENSSRRNSRHEKTTATRTKIVWKIRRGHTVSFHPHSDHIKRHTEMNTSDRKVDRWTDKGRTRDAKCLQGRALKSALKNLDAINKINRGCALMCSTNV